MKCGFANDHSSRRREWACLKAMEKATVMWDLLLGALEMESEEDRMVVLRKVKKLCTWTARVYYVPASPGKGGIWGGVGLMLVLLFQRSRNNQIWGEILKYAFEDCLL